MNPDFENKNKNEDTSRKKQKFHKISGIFFAIFILVVGTVSFVTEDIRFSEDENRVLTQIPRLDFDNILSGRFSHKFEKYSTDQIPCRNLWVEMKSRSDLMLGKREINEVFRGSEGFLFEKPLIPDSASTNEKALAINAFASKYKNIQTYFVLVPNASDILSQYLPDNAPFINQKEYIDSFYFALNDSISKINAHEALSEISDSSTFYRTDHHWTTDGAYSVFKKLAKTMNLRISDDDYKKLCVAHDFYGTLASKTGYYGGYGDTINVYVPNSENDQYVVNYVEEQSKSPSLYDTSKLDTKNKYEIFMRGNHPLVKIRTTAKNERSLLIIKDSYANCFIPFLTAHFSKITVVDPRYYYEDIYELIETEQVSHMLYLYNANTFFGDRFLSTVLNNE